MELEVCGLTVEVAGKRLIDGLDLTVGHGEVVGLVGPNGSGKSTTLRCAYRALRPTVGCVLLDGTDSTSLSLRECARRVAALTQENHTELDFTVEEVVAMGRTPHIRGNRALTGREIELCQRVLAQVGGAHLVGRSVLTLSGGERQRVLIARALAQEPRVLVLDEPTNHLDVEHQVAVLSLLRRAGLTVLVALHDLNLAAAACDRIAVLREGSLVAVDTPERVLTAELIREVFNVDACVVRHPSSGVPQLLYEFPAPERQHSTEEPVC